MERIAVRSEAAQRQMDDLANATISGRQPLELVESRDPGHQPSTDVGSGGEEGESESKEKGSRETEESGCCCIEVGICRRGRRAFLMAPEEVEQARPALISSWTEFYAGLPISLSRPPPPPPPPPLHTHPQHTPSPLRESF